MIMGKILKNLEKYLTIVTVSFTFIAVIPISPNPFVVSKLAILLAGFSLVILIKLIRTIYEGKLEFTFGTYDLPVLVIALSYILSMILRTPNKMEALLLPGTTTIAVLSVITYFLVNQLSKKDKDIFTFFLLMSGAIYSVIALFAVSGIFAKIPQLPLFIKQSTFTPEGGYLPSAIILATLIIIGVGLSIAEKNKKRKLVLSGLTALVLAGLLISAFYILPGKQTAPRFPSLGISWSIAVDTLKDSPLLGVGPGNYLTAFNRFKPLSFNTSDLWAIKFSTATNQYFTTLTETGLLGFAGIVLLLITVYKQIKKDIKEKKLVGWGFAGMSNLISLSLLLLLIGLFPATLSVFVLLFVLLSLNSTPNKTGVNLTSEVIGKNKGKVNLSLLSSRLPAILVTTPIFIVLVLTSIRATKILKAEYYFRQALAYLSQNEAVKSYDTMRLAINTNPQVDRYHSSYSQVNLAIANAIVQSSLTNQTQITDQDRTNIAQLIQQAIREGKSTVALNPLRSGNWEILARTYRAILPLANGADVFAAQTYNQAITLDPYNPNLRIALGGLYYAAGNFDTAIRIFETAVTVKPDLANAHYNLAYAYREAGRNDEAINQMSLVVSLVNRESADYEAARKALEDMQSNLSAKKEIQAEAPTGEELNPPTEAQEPVITPPIELEEGSEPPVAPEEVQAENSEEGQPSVTPQVSPTPIP